MRSISPIERKSPRPNKTKEELAKIRNEMMKKKFKDRSKQGSDQGETVTQYSNNYFQLSDDKAGQMTERETRTELLMKRLAKGDKA